MCFYFTEQINQNKLPMRPVDPRMISRGPDFTPAFADFGRQIPGGRGAPVRPNFLILTFIQKNNMEFCLITTVSQLLCS